MKNNRGVTVDLSSVVANWCSLRARLVAGAECAAVVKANAYGLGVKPVTESLLAAGCKYFFVANLEEALEISAVLPASASLYVLAGCREGEEAAFLEHKFMPVIVSLPMFERWLAACKKTNLAGTCALKINTGMNRLGMELAELSELSESPEKIQKAGVNLLMSHLACADEPDHELNSIQVQRFRAAGEKFKTLFPGTKLSLANSAGILLGDEYHFDLVRPGVALYGGQAQQNTPALKPVVHLKLEVIQARTLLAGESVGYGATKKFTSDRQIVVLGAGYADGIFRALGNNMQAWCKGVRIACVGRVSMDSVAFDVSDLPENIRPKEGELVELLGEHITVNELAERAGTVSYEILTSLGARYPRCFVSPDVA